jgi:hypothetical protein
MKNRLFKLFVLIAAGFVLTNCSNSIEKNDNRINNSIQSEKPIELTLAVSEELVNYLGVWSGPDYYPLVELTHLHDKINIRECYGLDAEIGTEYPGDYENGSVIAIGEEEKFYKWTLPTFKFVDQNMDTLIFNSGVGPVELVKTNESMPIIDYLPLSYKQ